MRKFVAACCCAIVGLQVLIVVPLITCLVVLGTLGEVGVQQVVEAAPLSAPAFPAATIPPPMSTTAVAEPPGWQVPTSPVAFPPVPSLADMPPPCADTKAPDSGLTLPPPPAALAEQPRSDPPPSLAPQVAAINEARQRLGSPIDESKLLAGVGDTHSEATSTLTRVAAEDNKLAIPLDVEPTVSEADLANSTAASPNICPPAIPSASPPVSPLAEPAGKHATECVTPHECPPTIVQSLQVAADQLYLKAQALEADGNYGRADQLRELARAIRREIETHRGAEPPPATVKSASYNQPVIPDGGTVIMGNRRTKTRLPLMSARAELAQPMAYPPETIMVKPRLIIVEEHEELLPLPVEKSPEKPAP